MTRLALAALAAILFTESAMADVTLVVDGKARCVVVAAPDVMAADKTLKQPFTFLQQEAEEQRRRLRESAKDLAHYLGKLSGATVEVVTDSPQPGDDRVPLYVGAPAEKRFGPPGKKAPYKQGFRMVVAPKGVGLLGESDLAASYAVYELLDRLGCRWYMPSDLGEVLPRMTTIRLKEIDFSSAPATIYRGIWYADADYMRRNRHGGFKLIAGHALEGYVTKEDREKHPEWRADIKGKPHPVRLKMSSPTLPNAIAKTILGRIAQEQRPSYSLSPYDGSVWDDTKADQALDADDFDPTFQGISMTDRLLVLCNRVVEQVTAKHPDVYFGLLAYARYTRPPGREKVHPNIVPQIAPITYSRAHPMTDNRVPGNKALRYVVEGWGKKARMTSIYFYGWFLAEPSAPNPMLTKWGTDVPFVLANNSRFWQPETQPNFETSMHCLYMGCRLAWDSSLKPQDVYDEINTRFYGAAAREMTAYWQFIDDVWVKTPEYSGCGFGYLRRWTPERMAQARKLIDAATAACETDVEKRRVRLADDSLRLFELFMKLRHDQAEGRFATLADGAAAWQKLSTELGEKYGDQWCFTRRRKGARSLGASYFASFYQKTYDDASRIARDFRILTEPPLRTFRYQPDPELKGEADGWAKADFADASWKTTDVAVDTWSSIGFHDYFKSMWYRTTVAVPPVPTGKKVRLWIGSTDGTAKVFVNGKHIPYVDPQGKKSGDVAKGYCEPFSFDVTNAIKPGARNTIAILCTRTFFNELGTGGLLAPVMLYSDKP
ncbi:MAG: DUF4838 domain-containing protein [Propionibacteriaceae bacterium]|nr:DUF4838 domain-containing protein [Propionibacteriaceae bacterium]